VPTPDEIAAAGSALGDLSIGAVHDAMRAAGQTLDAADAELGRGPASPGLRSEATGEGGARMAPGPARAERGSAPGPEAVPTGVTAWPAGARNALIYGGFATFVFVIQLALFLIASEESTLPMLAPVCLLVLPALAWAAGWLTIGAVFRTGGTPTKRTPRLGALICLAPNALLCAGLGVLFLAR
jgi:hypothetical protein